MASKKNIREYLTKAYKKLYTNFGPQYWWPADSPFEVVLGAILTQNTAWPNVEKAISNLKEKNLLSPQKIYRLKKKTLARIIRPCGYYNIKADRVKNFLHVLFEDFRGELSSMFSLKTAQLRNRLLSIKGVGEETADSIILYAAQRPVFVIDAYTKRFLLRHKLINQKAEYREIQVLFEKNLPRDKRLFNEYHALIVRLGKEFCRKKPLCRKCPLRKI